MMNLSMLVFTVMIYHSAFEYRTGDPESLFPYNTAIHDYSTPVVLRNPSLLPFARGLLLNSNAGRPYCGETLSSGGSAIQYGAGKYGFLFSWNMFGADFYRENYFYAGAGLSVFSFLHAGILENMYSLKIDMDELSKTEKFYDTDLSLLLTPFTWLNASFIQTGINSLVNGKKSEMIFPDRSAGILLKPGKGFSLSWNCTSTAIEKINTFEVAVNPASFFSIKGGYSMEHSSFALSLGILAENFFVSYGLKYHPYLGYSHSIGITFTVNTEIETLNYGTPLFSLSVKKINIQNATPDDLYKIDGLTAGSVDRIILYRHKIGAVTEKSLKQLGLTTDEIKSLRKNVYGLERTPRNKEGGEYTGRKKRKYEKRPPRNERIKSKFRALVMSGIPASAAISYSELSESVKNVEFRNRLADDVSLSDEQKKIIEKICSR